MANPSSTSSSERWPRALLPALLLVLLFDHFAFGIHGPWSFLLARVPHAGQTTGVARDRVGMQALYRAEEDKLQVVVVGSSRAKHGLMARHVPPAALERMVFAKIARPSIDPYGLRSVTDEALDLGTDVVVFVASEFDTHRPLRIVPELSFGSCSAVRDLVGASSLGFSWHNRQMLYRLSLGCMLRSYRFRGVVGAAFTDRLQHFPLDDRFVAPPEEGVRVVQAQEGALDAQRLEARDALYRELLPLFPEDSAVYRTEFRQIYSITRGEHVHVQETLIELAARRLAAAGSRLVILEAPLHPLAARIYDADLRQDFLTFVHRLEEESGVVFVPLEESGPYFAEDFSDLTHLTPEGARKLTHAMLRGVERAAGIEGAVLGSPHQPSGKGPSGTEPFPEESKAGEPKE